MHLPSERVHLAVHALRKRAGENMQKNVAYFDKIMVADMYSKKCPATIARLQALGSASSFPCWRAFACARISRCPPVARPLAIASCSMKPMEMGGLVLRECR